MRAASNADVEAEQMQLLCKRLKLPLTALEYSPLPKQPHPLPRTVETVLSTTLALAELATCASAPLLAADALSLSASLACGGELCIADVNNYTELVADQLAAHGSLDPVQLSKPAGPAASKDAARDGALPVGGLAAAWEAADGRGCDSTCERGSQPQTSKVWRSLMPVSSKGADGMSMHACYSTACRMRSTVNADLHLRLSAALLASACQANPGLERLMEHNATHTIFRLLGLPPLLRSTPAPESSTSKTARSRGGRRAAAPKKPRPKSPEASAAERAAAWAKSFLPQCAPHPFVASQLLFAVACSVLGQLDSIKDLAGHENANPAFSLLLLTMHTAQACVPVLDRICRHLAAVAALLACPAVACAALERGIGTANQNAILLPLLLAGRLFTEPQTPSGCSDMIDTCVGPQARGCSQAQPRRHGSCDRHHVKGLARHKAHNEDAKRREGVYDCSGCDSAAACEHGVDDVGLEFMACGPLDAAIAALESGAHLYFHSLQCWAWSMCKGALH